MKRLVIIAEGETEESFVNNILCPFFCSKGIYNSIQCFKTKHSHGGMSKYSYIKKDILNIIYEKDVVVSMMIDFYRLPSDFPGFNDLKVTQTHQEQANLLETRIKKDLENSQNQLFDNFIPYIQLHEFEALVFASISGIDSLFERSEMDYNGLMNVIQQYPNPEDINNHPDTAPSVRLKKLISGYNKVLHGIDIINTVGMAELLEKCPRFKTWIESMAEALV
ncbi:DUF4276 family protein [Prevotella melaninogenica]|uniref:DUF4276 family protein n=1 Tax=Prevotella melaninogenica TaxID=28132 RepID=UPI001C5D916A|nr:MULTISPECIES: DUF4276 family protein [Prevotella]MBF1593842.1 DUF4276 family protein [Prevotella sp.]MBW4740803.1 DUF4276 family protein [Prevotella melaninogenica]MBW4912307.1 DUF4276 family protein [Prevotella melaninogenica]